MTEVTEAYQSVLTQLRDWRRIAEKDRLDLLRIATSLMGRHFREAMAIIEKGPSYLQIYDLDLFYVLVMPTDKFLLFKSSSRLKQNDCSCL